MSASSTSAQVSGLTNGTSYTFVVIASNSVGDSPASAPSSAVTPQATVTTPPPTSPPSGARWLSGYYVGYQSSLYPPSAIDFSALTHIIVGRVRPKTDGTLYTDFDMDAVSGPAMAKDVSQRAHAAGRKAILMVGGAGEHDGFFGATSSANRAKFVANLLAAMDSYGYDGLDLDWEPLNDTDHPQILALLQDLRAARPGILLTFPVGWANSNFPSWTSPWYAQVASLVDQLNIMSYEMAGTWDGWTTWHSTALAGESSTHPSSISSSVNIYKSIGIPASKLGIGVGFYGACWRGPTGPGQSVSGASYVASDNTMSYAKIMGSYYSSTADRWDATAQVPYLSYASAYGPQGCTFVSYENTQSVTAKGNYVRNNGVGGAIVWTIAQGYIASATAGQRNPLLTALYGALAP